MLNFTIEDCLELLTGLNSIEGYSFTLEKEDYNILTSVARQVFKGTALTDRQFDMLARKFEKYTLQFEQNGIDITRVVDNKVIRTPFRNVDRTQRVYLEDKFIIAQFPFNKKLIAKIQKLRNETTGQIHNDKNKWKIELSEINVKVIGDTLSKFNFSQEFQDLYDTILTYKFEEHVPGIYKNELKNIHPEALANAEKECGDLKSNLIKYIDRRQQFGIEHIDIDINFPRTKLSEQIAFRKTSIVHIGSNIDLESVIAAIDELKRYPVLVVADEEQLEDVAVIKSLFSKYVNNEHQAVMFRMANDSVANSNFNEWVKENKLNNWVDNNTKVVYIKSTKVPKAVMLSCDPQCILNVSKNLRTYGGTGQWLTTVTDLRIDYAVKPLRHAEIDIIE